MSVRVSKPAFNLRSKLNELDRPVGAFGNQVLATENRYDASKLIGSGRKNVLINGDFKISQRGDYTSATAVTDDAYYLDRWKMRENGTAITIQHNKDITINEAGGDGIKTNSIKIEPSTATGYWAIRQIVEDYAAVSSQTVTFSCWVRGVGPKVFFRLWGVGNIGHGHVLTEDWQFYTETFGAPAATGAIDGNNGFSASITNYDEGSVTNHSDDWCEIALFQIEIGRSPTPFEFRTEAEELQLCQRYYERWGNFITGTGTGRGPLIGCYTAGSSGVANASRFFGWLPMAVRKRTSSPIITEQSILVEHTSLGNSSHVTQIGCYMQNSGPGLTIEVNTLGGYGVSGDVYHLSFYRPNNDAANVPYIAIDSEL